MKDEGIKSSPFYIRQKIELGIIAEDHCAQWVKIFILVILIIYMYGAMSLKYVSGAESFVEALSFMFYNNQCTLYEKMAPFDPYYLGIIVFGALSLGFSFGNIENSKYLQITTSIMRIIAITLMYIGTFYYLATDGI